MPLKLLALLLTKKNTSVLKGALIAGVGAVGAYVAQNGFDLSSGWGPALAALGGIAANAIYQYVLKEHETPATPIGPAV